MDKTTGRIALELLKRYKASEVEYWEDVDAWYRSGEGRSPKWVTDSDGRRYNMGGRGYSYPSCIHGSSRWTDYDNICGPCEDGYSVYQRALWEARGKAAEHRRRVDWLITAPDSLKRRTDEFLKLVEWASEPIKL